MNANVRRAMELALQIKDKQATIEALKQELDGLNEQLSTLVSGKGQARSVSRGKANTRKRGSRGPGIKEQILGHFQKGKRYRAIDFVNVFGFNVKTVRTSLMRLYDEGFLDRDAGAYFLPKKPKKKKKKGQTQDVLPRGYWKPKILSAMPEGKKMQLKEILEKMDVAKNKRAAAGTAIYDMAKKGFLVRVEEGVYIKKEDPKSDQKESKKQSKKQKPAIKNFQVKRLTPAQEEYLQNLKPHMVAARILQFMKHGKQYNLKKIKDKCRGVTPRATSKALKRLVELDLLDRVDVGVYVRN